MPAGNRRAICIAARQLMLPWQIKGSDKQARQKRKRQLRRGMHWFKGEYIIFL